MDIRIYCVRVAHYYAFGLTPRGAIEALTNEGGKAGLRIEEHVCRVREGKDGKHYTYVMHALPVGVTKVWVDEMGALGWEGPSEGLQQLYYNPNNGKWSPEEAKDERDPLDILEARLNPFIDQAADALESLNACNFIDTDSPEYRLALKDGAKRIRYALADLGV